MSSSITDICLGMRVAKVHRPYPSASANIKNPPDLGPWLIWRSSSKLVVERKKEHVMLQV